jgi:hypothetical protein
MVPDLVHASPRRVFCVYEHRHRNRDVADAVVRGRFPIQGVTLDLGLEPDWLGAPLPPDREWRLEWSKFYYGLDLAAAAEQSGDAKYSRAWRRLVRSWIAQVAVDVDPTDVVGRRIQNWVYAWSHFADREDLDVETPGFTAAITASLREQLSYLERHLTRERNHRTLELYALFTAALAVPDLDSDGRLLRFATENLAENLASDVLPDGVQRERSTHYHHVVLRSFVGFRENARRFDLPVPAGFDERLARACEFALHCHRPDGGIPALSDSDGGSYLDLLDVAGTLLNRPDFTYAARRGRSGTAPGLRHVSFPNGGYFIQRSGWGQGDRPLADERYLIFDCGPIGDGGHGHYDALNVEIAAGGRPLLVDPGRFTYCDDPPHWRHWFKGTAAHNTMTVDGLDQTPYRRGRPKGPVAEGRLLQRVTGDRLDLLWGEAISPAYDAVHRRRILFVADDYWIIEDTATADDVHRYQLRFHFAPDAAGRALLAHTSDGYAAIAPGVALVVVTEATAALEPGWVSPEYGIKHEAPIAAFTSDGVRDARFVTVVMPLSAGEREAPAVTVREADGRLVADIHRRGGPGFRDRVAWTTDGSNASAADSIPAGAASWTRRSESGAPSDGTALCAEATVSNGRTVEVCP